MEFNVEDLIAIRSWGHKCFGEGLLIEKEDLFDKIEEKLGCCKCGVSWDCFNQCPSLKQGGKV